MNIDVIIPVYNAEKYILNAVRSVQKIHCANINIILINDGSTDRSLEICKKLEGKYDNVYLISQENRGVSAARNRGIEYVLSNCSNSNEHYIGFLDADDTWLDALSGVEASAWGSDIIAFSSLYTNSRMSRFRILHQHDTKECTLRGENIEWLNNGVFCAALYKVSLIKEYDIRFPVGVKLNEDVIFFRMATFSAKTIFFSHLYLYAYRNVITSATHTIQYNRKHTAGIPLAWIEASKWADKTGMYSAEGAEKWKKCCMEYAGVFALEMIVVLLESGDSITAIEEWIETNSFGYILDDLDTQGMTNKQREDYARYKKGLPELEKVYKKRRLIKKCHSLMSFLRRCCLIDTIMDKFRYPYKWKDIDAGMLATNEK